MNFQRFGIYFAPQDSALAQFGTSWLGWDLAQSRETEPPEVSGLPLTWDEITATPRKYGFHATIKPPFRLADGTHAKKLRAAFQTHCDRQPPVVLDGLDLVQLGRFLALVTTGDTQQLNALANKTVSKLDHFRAPPTEAELTKRRASGLTPTQDALLLQWGYPYVMDAFRFHMTLTGKLPKAECAAVLEALSPVIAPLLPSPFVIDALSLVGEDANGRFHLIQRHALSG